jgi:arylsulfatase A-like enzyme
LRGKKRDLYEGGIRVPFVAWWPGTIKAGEESTHVSAFWDLFPTVCELIGVEVPSNLDGISFLPTLLGTEQPQHDHLYWEFHEQGKKQAVRKGAWKAVRNDVFENKDAPIELYNLSEDLKESKNLANQHPEIVQELKEIMDKAHVPDPNWPLFESETSAISSIE